MLGVCYGYGSHQVRQVCPWSTARICYYSGFWVRVDLQPLVNTYGMYRMVGWRIYRASVENTYNLCDIGRLEFKGALTLIWFHWTIENAHQYARWSAQWQSNIEILQAVLPARHGKSQYDQEHKALWSTQKTHVCAFQACSACILGNWWWVWRPMPLLWGLMYSRVVDLSGVLILVQYQGYWGWHSWKGPLEYEYSIAFPVVVVHDHHLKDWYPCPWLLMVIDGLIASTTN